MNKKQLRRRAYLLYKLRKKGIRCLTRQFTIFYPYGKDPVTMAEIVHLEKNSTSRYNLKSHEAAS